MPTSSSLASHVSLTSLATRAAPVRPVRLPPAPIALAVRAELATGCGHRLAFAPDGAHWVAASAGTVQLWRDTTQLATLRAPSAVTDRVRFNRDGSRLLLAPYTYDFARGAWLDASPLGDPLAVALHGAAWDADGDALVVSAGRATPELRDAGQRGPRAVILRSRLPFESATLRDDDQDRRALSIDDLFVAMASDDIHIWSRVARRLVATLRGHGDPVADLAFGASGFWLASLDASGMLVVWDAVHWMPRARIWTSRQPGLALATHPTRPIVATGGYDGVVRLWHIDDDTGACSLLAHYALGAAIPAISFSPDGSRVLVASHALPTRITVFALEG